MPPAATSPNEAEAEQADEAHSQRRNSARLRDNLANLPDSKGEEFAGATLAALRWLETLPPPEILASRLADDSGYRRGLNVAMPHNSPAKGDFARYHPDLAPVLRATPDHDGPLFAVYCWTDDASSGPTTDSAKDDPGVRQIPANRSLVQSVQATEIERTLRLRQHHETGLCRREFLESFTMVQLSNGTVLTWKMARQMGHLPADAKPEELL